jgi:hypothetical protein
LVPRLLKHVNSFRDRHGQLRHYFRRRGQKAIPLPGLFGSTEFMAAYGAALAMLTDQRIEVGAKRTLPGTIDALVVGYYQSGEWQNLAAETQKTRRRIIERFREKHGAKRVSLLKEEHFRAMLAAINKLSARRHWLIAIKPHSYDAERRAVFASTARDFIEKAIFVDRDFLAKHDPARDSADFEAAWRERQSGARAEVNAFEPNYEGSPIVFGPAGAVSSAIGSHAYTARAGHHLTPQPLSSGRNVFEELGDGFTLIDLGANDTATGFETAASALNVPLKVIRDSAADGREKYASRLILVRPDQFVAWAGVDAEPSNILRRATGRL